MMDVKLFVTKFLIDLLIYYTTNGEVVPLSWVVNYYYNVVCPY